MRTVYRDVEALSAAGVPIHMERGPQGGIVLADDYRRALAQFTNDELQALFAGTAGPMSDLGIASHERALQKLAGALPAAQRRAAEHGRERLLLDHNRWYRNEQPRAELAVLRQAIANERRVSLRYHDRSGAPTDRVVDPLGLVAKAGVWYLVAREADKGYRTFRAERISLVRATPEHFQRPADFDLDAHWQSSIASIEQRASETYDAVLRVRPDALQWITPYWETDLLGDEPDGTLLRVRFPIRVAAVSQVVALGDAVSIVEPPDLGEAVVRCAQAALARHAPSPSPGAR